MKRILSIILCITVLFTLCFTVNASSSSTLKGNSECVVGENISLTLDISNCPDVTSIGVSINTGDAFEFVSYEWLQDATLKGFYEDQLDGALAFDKSTNINGELITVTLKALSLGTEEKVSVRIIGKNAGDTVYQETVTKSIDVVCGKHDFGPAETFDADNHKQVCKLCNAEIISAHNWDKGTVTRTATCISAGNKRFTCSTCGQVKNEEIPKLSFHTFNDWKVEKEATCTESGTEIRICSYCQIKETRVIEATGHKYGDWEVENKATCTEPGTEARVCEYCGAEETRAIGATGHKYGDWKVEKEATCTESGTEVRVCEYCKAKETRAIEATGHKYGDWKVEKEAACTESGIEARVCEHCGTKETRAIEATGHKYGDWTVTKEATCIEAGVMTKKCANCNVTETKTIDALGHDFENPVIVKEPTISTTGLKEGKCKHCNEVIQEIIPCTVKDEITGIILQTEEGTFKTGTVFVVNEIKDPASKEFKAVQKALNGIAEKFVSYDIYTLLEGEKVQPNGKVKITFQVPEGFGNSLKVYYIDDEGNIEEQVFVINEDGTITVEFSHFSTYAICEVKADADPNNNKTDNNSNALVWIIITLSVVVIGGVVIFFAIKKKKR